jgi:HK97 family phage prohead protease
MKSLSIVIPDLDRYAAKAHLAARMGATAPGGVHGIMFANHAASLMERPAVRGFACTYNTVFTHKGVLTALLPGCFAACLASRSHVDMQLEHNDNTVFGSTDTGLAFTDCQEGLAFEFPVPKSQAGAILLSMVASGDRPDVSVSADIIESTTREFQGHDVRLVSKANLLEISVCRDGAIGKSHARIVDLAEAPSLQEELASGLVAFMGRQNELATQAKATRASLERKLDAIERDTAPTRRAYTVDGHRVAPD